MVVDMADADTLRLAREIVLSGHVQSVGFRPFIFHLANEHGLHGWVRNCTGEVKIHVEGRPHIIDTFVDDIFVRKPDLAKPVLKSDRIVEACHYHQFIIKQSEARGDADIQIPPDLFVCNDCLRELYDPANRRYRYPFINCTQCGPRYTLITALPYDRANTTMREFALCPACEQEYLDVDDRRFHAEPIACESCGPALKYVSLSQDASLTAQPHADQLEAAAIALEQGHVVAVKGIGGYHLMCDATSKLAVEKIRQRKPRPDKPLAVMFPSSVHSPFDDIEQHVVLDNTDREFLLQPSRPLLLVQRKHSSSLASNIAPGLDEVGVMLPYSPLHHLLMDRLRRPLVATSANISGEPVMIDNTMVEDRLAHIVDACLHHNRPIARPADDPVYRKIGQRPRPLRLGRGTAPLELTLPFTLPQPVLAVGAHMKNTIALGWRNRVVVSPHIGEMDSRRSLEAFEQSVNDLQRLYQVKPEMLLRDTHAGYTTHRWARDYADVHHLPVRDVYHHHAHASAVYGEYRQTHDASDMVDMLVFTWDGTGYGVDGTLWGGEVLLGKAGQWRRVASLEPFELPGGDRVAREPWWTAAALCWQNGLQWQPKTVADSEYRLLKQAWQKKLNTTRSSAMGRLFDAASALSGLCEHASFEGQGPMWLEALCTDTDACLNPVEFELNDSGDIIMADWSPLLPMLQDHTLSTRSRADSFHDSAAMLMLQLAQRLNTTHDIRQIGCTGGVFQNRTLFQRANRLLTDAGFDVFLPELIPVNDAGISYGQIIEYGSMARSVSVE